MPIFGFTNVAGSVITQTSIAVASGGASDPDAQAFITAASITDPTEISAVDQLVIDLKSYNIWTKMKAIYPVLGGSASSHAVNLITPGTYNLTFSTGWTHASTGMTPNGTSAYADTLLATSTAFGVDHNKHLSFYSRTNLATAGNSSSIGSDNGSTGFCRFTIRGLGNIRVSVYGGTNGTASALNETDSRGFYQASRTSSTASSFYKNAILIAGGASANGTTSQITQTLLIGAARSGASITYYDNKECSFASIGDSLDATETSNFYTAVQAYQTTLSRNV